MRAFLLLCLLTLTTSSFASKMYSAPSGGFYQSNDYQQAQEEVTNTQKQLQQNSVNIQKHIQQKSQEMQQQLDAELNAAQNADGKPAAQQPTVQQAQPEPAPIETKPVKPTPAPPPPTALPAQPSDTDNKGSTGWNYGF